MNDNVPQAQTFGRQRLDDRRPAERVAFSYKGFECSALVGLRLKRKRRRKSLAYERTPEGALIADIGDVFIDAGAGKVGSDLESIALTGAVILSLGLQRGADIRDFAHSIPRLPDGQPTDIIGAAIDAIVNVYFGGRDNAAR
jgi:hypothetical protein